MEHSIGDTPLVHHFMTFDDLITELFAAGAEMKETDKVSHLLLTLPQSYDGIITAIETLSEDSLTVAFVKTRLLDHEVKLETESRDTRAKVLNVNRRSDTQNFNFKRNNFKKYNKKKHSNFKPKIKNNIKCHHCGRKGHKIINCFYYKKSQQRNQQNQRTVQTVQLSENPINDTTNSFAFMAGNLKMNDDINLTFLLDSGASDHLINQDKIFSSYTELSPPINISVAKNGVFITATKKGKIDVVTNIGIKCVLEDVLYSPEVPHNLLSVSKMQKAGLTIIFDNKGIKISRNGKIVMTGIQLNNLVAIDFKIDKTRLKCNDFQVNNVGNCNYKLWHQRLGHIGKSKFLEMKNKQMVIDFDIIEQVILTDHLCEACINGKQARLPFQKFKNKDYIQRPLFIVHSDVCGPITPSTVDNKNYFVLFVNEFTHYCVTYLITYKSDVFSVFQDFVAKSTALFNSKLVHLYIDNGREYLSTEMKNYCVQKGISYHLTVPRTPQLNGVSERMVRTITEKARAIICGASLQKVFWGEAVLTATYLINLTPTKALKCNKTPYEMWHNKKPQIKYLRVFGSTVFTHNKIRKTKFDEKSWKGILVGYVPNGYKVWDVENEKFVLVRDVIIDETNYLVTRPLKKSGVNEGKETDESDIRSKSVVQLQKSDKDKSDMFEKSDIDKSDTKSHKSEKGNSDISSKCDNYESDNEIQKLSVSKSIEKGIVDKNAKINNKTRRSERIKQRPPISYNEYNIEYDYIMIAETLVKDIPVSYNEIKIRDDRVKWEEAINDEINSLMINKTWTLVSRPNDRNIVDCKWIFTIKYDEFGNPLRYKARLVARGFSQEYLIDYNETFAPVARISSFRFIVAFANQFNLLIHHMDVKTAFLNGILKEEIYMRVPQGVKCNANQVCKLNKALYGLKQAARCWFEMFEKALIEKGFQNSSVDRCIYILDRGNIHENIYVVLYVDDLVIATANIEVMNNFKNYLMNKFSMTDLKDIKLFLGIKVERTVNKIFLDQSAYIKKVLEKFKMSDCKAVSTPLPSKLNYFELNSDETYDAPCRNLIGCIMYIMICTRPDLCVAINILSRYTNKNNKELWQNLKRVLRYLKGSINIKLNYVKQNYNDFISGFVDSDWGGNDELDRKSTTGYLFKLFENCTISWNTRKQASVAASSTEAEYMALFEAVREALWLRSLAISIKIKILEPIVIYEDNNGCISIASNPTNHKRSKHIDIKYHFSREQVEKNIVKLIYIPTGNQLADALTKPLPAVKFLEFRKEMGLE